MWCSPTLRLLSPGTSSVTLPCHLFLLKTFRALHFLLAPCAYSSTRCLSISRSFYFRLLGCPFAGGMLSNSETLPGIFIIRNTGYNPTYNRILYITGSFPKETKTQAMVSPASSVWAFRPPLCSSQHLLNALKECAEIAPRVDRY